METQMKTAPLAVTAALLVAGVGAATAVAPASAADRPTTQTVTSTTDSADQAGTNVADPSRFEFRISNASKSTHAPYIYESFRVMGNTPPDDYARVLPRQGITKQLKAKTTWILRLTSQRHRRHLGEVRTPIFG